MPDQLLYTYPPTYTMLESHPRSAYEQLDILSTKYFARLDPEPTREYIKNVCTQWYMDPDSEGLAVIPKMESVQKYYSPPSMVRKIRNMILTDVARRKCVARATRIVLRMLKNSRAVANSLIDEEKNPVSGEVLRGKNEIHSGQLQETEETRAAMLTLEEKQPGHYIVFPFNFGKMECGHSARESKASLVGNKFFPGLFATTCLVLTHPEREDADRPDDDYLQLLIAGDKFADKRGSGFNFVVVMKSSAYQLRIRVRRDNVADPKYGAVVGWLPDKL
jgi:hypothetical protein